MTGPESIFRNGRARRRADMKKRKYYRKCGICGERYEQSEMVRDECSPTGWICFDCCMGVHPEYEED